MPAPLLPATLTRAVPVAPEHTVFSVESQPGVRLPVIVISEASSGAGTTLTATGTVGDPPESCTVTVRLVAAVTLLAASTTVSPDTFVETGRIVASLEKTRYGGTPPEIVSVAGVPG